MKWTTVTLNFIKVRKTVQLIAGVCRTFGLLTLSTVLFFVLLALAGYLQAKAEGNMTPASSIKGFAAAVSSQFFMDMMAMEIPYLKEEGKTSLLSQKNVMHFLFRYLTDIDTQDPKTFVAGEVPGMANDRSTLVRKGVASASSDAPMDHYAPPKTSRTRENSRSTSPQETKNNDVVTGDDRGNTGQKTEGAATPGDVPPDPSSGKDIPPQQEDGSGGKAPEPSPEPAPPVPKKVFIYHSHNQESFLPELPEETNPDKAYDSEKNITLVGKRLAAGLEKRGVGVVHSGVDYPSVVEGFHYAYSYKYSLGTLKEAVAANKDLQFFFDIHRDSQIRSKTTVRIGGVDYAQVYFILGEKNPNWKQNEQFAAKIHALLESKYPGISKGIHSKGWSEGNGEYNQSFSPNSVIIEIGGPYNTLEEAYRTADLLAEVIAEIVLEAQKVDAPAGTAKR